MIIIYILHIDIEFGMRSEMIRVATRATAADAIKRFYYSEVPVILNAKTI